MKKKNVCHVETPFDFSTESVNVFSNQRFMVENAEKTVTLVKNTTLWRKRRMMKESLGNCVRKRNAW